MIGFIFHPGKERIAQLLVKVSVIQSSSPLRMCYGTQSASSNNFNIFLRKCRMRKQIVHLREIYPTCNKPRRKDSLRLWGRTCKLVRTVSHDIDFDICFGVSFHDFIILECEEVIKQHPEFLIAQ
jgi:hypothetical protein